MKKQKYFLVFFLILVGVLGTLWLSAQAGAQEGVIEYLYSRFKEQKIPVKEIVVLENNPLHILIVIQSPGDSTIKNYYTSMMRLVDRELQLYAPQQGYFIDSYTRILLDDQGKKLDETSFLHLDQDKASRLNFSQATLSDEGVQNMVSEEIQKFMMEYPVYHIDEGKLNISISSEDNYQILTLEAETNSLEEANRIAFFMWNLPNFPLLPDINEQGAQIALYKAKVIDKNGRNMLDFTYDLQLGSGSWSIDPRLENPSGAHPPGP